MEILYPDCEFLHEETDQIYVPASHGCCYCFNYEVCKESYEKQKDMEE